MPRSQQLHPRLGINLFGMFLALASGVAAIAALTVLFPHSPLVAVWSFKEAEYRQLLGIRLVAGVGFLVLSAVLAMTAIGWFRHHRWAWFLAYVILAINLVSDLGRAIFSMQWADAAGALLEGLILIWIMSKPVRKQFLRSYDRGTPDS